MPRSDIPELDPDAYARDVLHLGSHVAAEKWLEDGLARRAAVLGRAITFDDPLPPRTTAAADSTATTATSHPRTSSAASGGSDSTTLTSQCGNSHGNHHGDHHSDASANGWPAASEQTDGLGLVKPTQQLRATLLRRRSRSMTFSYYDKFLQTVGPGIAQPQGKFLHESPSSDAAGAAETRAQTTPWTVVGTRRSIANLKANFKNRMSFIKMLRRASPSRTMSCICCRNDFNKSSALHTLSCGHIYCVGCLHVIVMQSTTDESKMPPRCCAQGLPSTVVKAVLARDEHLAFLNAVRLFSTPWEARVFCPAAKCAKFIPPRRRIDPKHPFEVVCRECGCRVCKICKQAAHPLGEDCPEDWELDMVLQIGERSGWRRCYNCRSLVELSQGCTHMTCRCKAEFCYVCGAVWDPIIGCCPNHCCGDDELDRRAEEAREMEEDEARRAAAAAAAAAEETEQHVRAEQRSRASPEFRRLRSRQEAELGRFLAFGRKVRWLMWSRHEAAKAALAGRLAEQIAKVAERHDRTAASLEDRQLQAEIDLRASLDASERSVHIRLKHMEAYCDGLGRCPPAASPGSLGFPGSLGSPGFPGFPGSPGSATTATTSAAVSAAVSAATSATALTSMDGASSYPASRAASPVAVCSSPRLLPRTVTERDLRELGQQYNLRDGIARLHAARINVLRDRQAKMMEELLDRQADELARLEDRRDDELDSLTALLTAEQEALAAWLEERGAKMRGRWRAEIEVLRGEMEWLTVAREEAGNTTGIGTGTGSDGEGSRGGGGHDGEEGSGGKEGRSSISFGVGFGAPQWPEDEGGADEFGGEYSALGVECQESAGGV